MKTNKLDILNRFVFKYSNSYKIMKKGVLIITAMFIVLVLSMNLISASWFSDFWNKVSGNVLGNVMQATGEPQKELIAYYEFEDNSNDSIGGNNGTAYGNPAYVEGKVGKAISFDGINDYVKYSTISYKNYTSFSVGFWFKANSLSQYSRIFSIRYSGSDDIRVYFDTNVLRAAFDDATPITLSTGFTDTSEWHHVILVNDGSVSSLYLDGVLKDSKADVYNFAGTEGLTYAGAQADLPVKFFYSGLMDELKLWDSALTSQEVQEEYESYFEPECLVDENCSVDFYSSNYCSGKNVSRDLHDFSCQQGACVENITSELVQECFYGCENGLCLEQPAECILTNAYWSKTNAVEGESVSLSVEGTNCDGKEISFEVLEDDFIGDDAVSVEPGNAVFSSGKATSTWTAEYLPDIGTPEYYFIGTLVSDLSKNINSKTYTNGILVVSQIPPPQVYDYDVVIVGGGISGFAAAIQAARMGVSAAIVEETDWIGGQMTAAGVLPVDGNNMLFANSGIFLELKNRVNEYYDSIGWCRTTCRTESINGCWEPRVAQAEMLEMLQEENVDIYLNKKVSSSIIEGTNCDEVSGCKITGITTEKGDVFNGKIIIDATENGDVIPLTPAKYRVGVSTSDNLNLDGCVQDITYAATIKEYPAGIPENLQINTAPMGFEGPPFNPSSTGGFSNCNIGVTVTWPDFINYRGSIDSTIINPGFCGIKKTQLNHGCIDVQYSVREIEDPTARKETICDAKLSTLQLLYYIQSIGKSWSIAVEENYNTQYQEENLCDNIPEEYKDIERRMSVTPYVRESRRIIGVYPLTQKGTKRTADFDTSVAVAGYADDFHECKYPKEADLDNMIQVPVNVFQVPFESFIPEKLDGFLPSEKNIYQSRTASSSTRVHPSMMNIGQASGAISAVSVLKNTEPRNLNPKYIQYELAKNKVKITNQDWLDVSKDTDLWGYSEFLDVIDLIEPVIAGNGKYLNPDENVINKNLAETLVDGFRISKVYVQGQSFSDVPIDYPEYKEIEALKINSIYGGCGGGMFCPDDHLTKAEFAVILSKILNLDLTGVLETPHFSDVNSEDNGFLEIQALYEHGLIDDESLCGINLFCPDSILTREDLVYLLAPALIYHEGAVIEEPSSQVIADNNGDVVKTGNWGSSNVVFGYTGSDYNFMAPGSGQNKIRWNFPSLPLGIYNVYVRYTDQDNRASNAPYTIHHNLGEDVYLVNQRTYGGRWHYLDSFEMSEDSYIELSDNANNYVIADAVKLEFVGSVNLGCTDNDGDGYSIEGGACGAVDCDDSATGNNVHPGAVEIECDGIDQDCDGVDYCCYDNDNDGYFGFSVTCVLGDDCNDADININPGMSEVCNDGLDNDCDDLVDCDDLDCYGAGSCSGFADLIVYYPFDDDTNDYSGNNHNGTAYGNPAYVDGKVGKAISFDGINDYVKYNTINYKNFTSLSVGFWFKANALTQYSRIFSIRYSGGDDIRVYFDSGVLRAAFDDATPITLSTGFTDTSSWHHVILVNNGSVSSLYLDGVLKDSKADVYNFAGTEGLTYAGAQADLPVKFFYSGLMDELKLWDSALTSQEVQEAYDSYLEPEVLGPGGGGWINALVITPTIPTTIYAGSDVGGIYKSTDNGETWEIKNKGLKNYFIDSIAIDPKDKDIAYATTLGGVYKSVDGGENWLQKRNGFPDIKLHSFSAPVSALAIDSNNTNIIYAGIGRSRQGDYGQGRIYKTMNAGENWSIVNTGSSKINSSAVIYSIAVDSLNSNVLYTVTDKGLYKSIDGGVNWLEKRNGLPNYSGETYPNVRKVIIDPFNSNILYATVHSKLGVSPWQGGVYKSIDGGETWIPKNTGLANLVGKPGEHELMTSNYEEVLINPKNSSVLYVGDVSWVSAGVYKSSDGGNNWSRVSNRFVNVEQAWIHEGLSVKSLAMDSSKPDRLYFGTSMQVYKTEDAGITWTQVYTTGKGNEQWLGRGLETTSVRDIAVDSTNPKNIYVGYSDIGFLKSTDGGISFNQSVKGTTYKDEVFTITIDSDSPNIIYSAAGDTSLKIAELVKSVDYGETWSIIGNSSNGLSAKEIHSIVIDSTSPVDSRTLYVTSRDYGIYKSIDGGKNWTSKNNGLGANLDVYKLIIVPNNTNNLYVGIQAKSQSVEGYGGIYKTTNGGENWTKANANIELPDVKALAISPTNSNIIYAGTKRHYTQPSGPDNRGGVYKSTDGGVNWQVKLNKNYPFNICDLAVSPVNPNLIFAASCDDNYHDESTGSGLFRSSDGGETWEDLKEVNEKLSSLNLRVLAAHPANPNIVYAGSGGNSFFKIHNFTR